MVKRALLIAYHYPPVRGSSGVQRTLAFSKYLQEHDWQSIVLTAHPRANENSSDDQMDDIPEQVIVRRAFALDTKKHLSIKGRYPSFLALPDRWSSWWLGGLVSGLLLIKKYRPKVIFSTYPVATAHLIGYTLNKLTGTPWVADFRDSMIDDSFPVDQKLRAVHSFIEKRVVESASRVLLTTKGAVKMYRERYPSVPDHKWQCLPNGFNEEIFSDVESSLIRPNAGENETGRLVLLHSGVIYPSERDPVCFFQALKNLKNHNKIDHTKLSIVLRATGHDAYLKQLIKKHGIEDLVQLKPGLPYREALTEMINADALLILQAANCNHQIPAKLYEYFRSKRPIFAMTDITGNTATELAGAGYTDIVQLSDADKIASSLMLFISSVEKGTAPIATDEIIMKFSRQSQTEDLANIFNEL